MRKYQLRFLDVLSQAEGPLDKWHLIRLADLPNYEYLSPNCEYKFTDAVGLPDEGVRQRQEKRVGYLSLVTLGYVRCYLLTIEETPTWVYKLTETGRCALDDYKNRLANCPNLPSEVKNCKACGEPLRQNEFNYCPLPCNLQQWQHSQVCEVCEAAFNSTRSDARYCPTKCRVAAHRQRRAHSDT